MGKIYITEEKLKKIVKECVTNMVNEAYYNDDATPEQRVAAAHEIADTYNDSAFSKESKRRVSGLTVLDFIKLNGGLQKVGNMNVYELMKLLNDYIN